MVRKTLLVCCAASAVVLGGCLTTTPEPKVEQKQLVFPGPPDEPRFVFERTISNSSEVVPEEEESTLKQLLTGQASNFGEGFAKPYAVAVHQGRIYVSDSATNFVRVFDVREGKYFNLGEEDILKPLGIDVDKAGNVYVADASAKSVHVFDRDGKKKMTVGVKMFDRLSSVGVDPEGTRIYVVDIGGVQSQNHRVRVFDAKTGEFLSDIGKRGSGPGDLNLPRDVAVGKDGRLYVSDGGNFRVNIYDRDGKFIKSFGQLGKHTGTFARPKELATDRDGNVYVADAAFGNFQIFSPEGELLMFIGERSENNGPARYMLPSGIYVDEDGRVYFVDQWFKKLDVFRPAKLKEDEGWAVYKPSKKGGAKDTKGAKGAKEGQEAKSAKSTKGAKPTPEDED